MSVKQHKMISPGISVQEINSSQLPDLPRAVGPVIIGKAQRGPAMRPVKINSFSEFVEVFGDPVGQNFSADAWREGNLQAPSYAAYGAQAWLKNNSPCTFVRLLGYQHENATSAGNAGWNTKDTSGTTTGLGVLDSNGGAYGLFLINKGSDTYGTGSGNGNTNETGSLAAVFYINEGSIVLSGTTRDGSNTTTGSGIFLQSLGNDSEFKAIIRDTNSNVTNTTTFNFNRNSDKYIRKVFNTNPTLTNTAVTLAANTASYWLGETYEKFANTQVTGTSGLVYGVILGLKSGSVEGSGFRMASQQAQTGWFFSQDLQSVTGAANSYQPENMTNLFRFHCLYTGEWSQKNLKISIQDIKTSTNQNDPYGSFSVVVRKVNDSDNAVRVVERFSSCNLNPFSNNYIGKKIGDKYETWDDTEGRYIEYGNYNNNSKFLRVEMNADVEAGATDPLFLPFGVYGPPRFKAFTVIGTENAPQTYGVSVGGSDFGNSIVKGNADIVRSLADSNTFINAGTGSADSIPFTGSFLFPALSLRSSSVDGNLANPQDAYFGLDNSIVLGTTRADPGYCDMVRAKPSGFNSYAAADPETEYSWAFTLDDIIDNGAHANYSSGSRAAGTSKTAQSANNYKEVLSDGFDRFTAPLFGGFDGLDIAEKEPFNNTDLESGTQTTNYSFYSVKRAIDSCSDPELVECNVMTMPGITNEALTSHLINTCEDRGDCLGIIDLKGGFLPGTENNNGDSAVANRGSVTTTITNLEQRGLDNSYGCAYYPWVQIRDSINDSILWCPPSVVALGTMASSEKNSELWFAPAGFTRGGLSEGSAGIPVIGVRERLTTKQRDKLYEARINPIASFPAEGIVIFGQKTLIMGGSALDRINVRRLLIYVKREISRMAATILFDQNVRVTWNRFLSKARPFLRSVQVRLGLEDWKMVLDETTTTPDLIDRNILYAIVYLKPARAIEYIALDFSIHSSGASFAD